MMPPSDQAAAAQARRDRARLAAAQAEIATLRRRVLALEHSPSRRLFGPARRLRRLVDRLLGRGGTDAAPTGVPSPTVDGSPDAVRGIALVIDNDWPQPDRDAGSVVIVQLMQALHRLGFAAVLAAAKQHDGPQPARDRLVQAGLRCLGPTDAESVGAFIAARGAEIGLGVLCRVYCGGEFLEAMQRDCRQARLVFEAIDLNYLREERRAKLTGDAALLALTGQLRQREEHIIRSCDATVVVSQAEADLLAQTVPEALTVSMPLAHALRPPATPFGQRSGIGFIGSFAHAPNADAVRSFLAEVWPLIRRELPECRFSIVGADPPPGLADGIPGVEVAGHVPDVGPWFEALRLTVAPLRYGAGAKGKVASSLAAGVPCVLTTIAAEGMALAEDGGVLVADDPAAFAAAVVGAYRDEAAWTRLSAGALDYARTTLSPDAWQERLAGLLRRIGF